MFLENNESKLQRGLLDPTSQDLPMVKSRRGPELASNDDALKQRGSGLGVKEGGGGEPGGLPVLLWGKLWPKVGSRSEAKKKKKGL